MKNIAVFASHNGSNLQAIIDACNNGTIQARVCVVISNNKNSFSLERARKNNIPNLYLNTKSQISEEEMNKNLFLILKLFETDIIILAGYMKKISDIIVSEYRDRIFNIHPSLLPKYGGKGMYGEFVHQAVIDAKEKSTGVTIHKVDEIIDGGYIVAQIEVPVLETDDKTTLGNRVLEVEHTFLIETLKKILINS